MNEFTESSGDSPAERPWIVLGTTYDVEAWIDNYNRELQYSIGNARTGGYGICFRLEAGGEIYLHTNGDGDIMLDVLPDAQWVAPLITAATSVPDLGRQVWALPGDCLTQLIFGLSSLIASTRIVLSHDFRMKKL